MIPRTSDEDAGLRDPWWQRSSSFMARFRADSQERRRRHLWAAAVLLLLLLWLLFAAPILSLGFRPSTALQARLVLRGSLVAILALGFTLTGSWGANGFTGGTKLWWWRALWPIWSIAAPVLAVSAATRSPAVHLGWLVYALFIGFSEEAIFRGVFLRALLPDGARNAILWSSFWFAAIHLPGLSTGVDWRIMLPEVSGAFAGGLIFAWARLASASIWPAVIAHAFFDYSFFIYFGGMRESLAYSPSHALGSALITLVLFGWAFFLLSPAMTKALTEPISAHR
jgi:membrane protease YdiL (CAAX protease family)